MPAHEFKDTAECLRYLYARSYLVTRVKAAIAGGCCAKCQRPVDVVLWKEHLDAEDLDFMTTCMGERCKLVLFSRAEFAAEQQRAMEEFLRKPIPVEFPPMEKDSFVWRGRRWGY